MNDIIYFLAQTVELWVFVGILAVALFVEEGVVAYNRKQLKNNPTLL